MSLLILLALYILSPIFLLGLVALILYSTSEALRVFIALAICILLSVILHL